MIVTPNQISATRIVMSPVVFILIIYQFEYLGIWWQTHIAGALFTILSLTDFLDGYLARKYNIQTILGKILDPLADKLLIISALIALLYVDKIDVWAVYLILSREYIITGLRIILVKYDIDVSSSFIGKTKTVVQMFAIGFSMMGWVGADILVWSAVIFTLYSGVEYVVLAYKKLKIAGHIK